MLFFTRCFQGFSRMLFRTLPILFLLLFINQSYAAVWEAKNKWDNRWEKQYQTWVNKNWTEEFFMDEKKPLYNKLEHDCADATYLMRLIFSYERKLPFIVNNPQKRGKLISNKMKRWDKLPQHKRVRAFMDYISDMTSTKSLKNDTYPVALNDLKPGDLYVAPGVHSYQVVNITDTGIAEVMASTTPKAPRFMSRIASFPFYVPEDIKNESDGYRRWKWPSRIQKPNKVQPGYSPEQYKIAKDVKMNYVAFTDIIARRLGKRAEQPAEKTLRLLIALCMYANDRAVYVYDALWHLQKVRKKGRQCMNRQEYDAYSTPSRDKRLAAFFGSVKHHLDKSWKLDSRTRPQIMAATVFNRRTPPPRETKLTNDFCMVQMSLGEKYYISLRELRQNIESGRVISDPHASLEHRWGIAQDRYVPKCKTY